MAGREHSRIVSARALPGEPATIDFELRALLFALTERLADRSLEKRHLAASRLCSPGAYVRSSAPPRQSRRRARALWRTAFGCRTESKLEGGAHGAHDGG